MNNNISFTFKALLSKQNVGLLKVGVYFSIDFYCFFKHPSLPLSKQSKQNANIWNYYKKIIMNFYATKADAVDDTLELKVKTKVKKWSVKI